MPSLNHGLVQANLIGALLDYRDRYTVVSELTLDLGALPNNTTPDVSVFGPMDIDYTHDRVRVSEPPLVTVEIVSPSQSTQDVADKIHAMLDAGVRSAWLVQPAMQTVTVYREGEKPRTFSKGVIHDDTLEEVEVTVNEVFGGAS